VRNRKCPFNLSIPTLDFLSTHVVNLHRFFLIFYGMICVFGKHTALPCRYSCLEAFFNLKIIMQLVIYAYLIFLYRFIIIFSHILDLLNTTICLKTWKKNFHQLQIWRRSEGRSGFPIIDLNNKLLLIEVVHRERFLDRSKFQSKVPIQRPSIHGMERTMSTRNLNHGVRLI
jgi:hypothetical protein